MYKDRRKMTQGIVWVGANALIGHQDLIADVQRVLHQPSLGLGDKDLKDLEQKIRDYWLDYYGVTVAPADLMLHVVVYVQDVKTLLGHSLLPSIRTRLCACLSQGMLLIGVNCYAVGQFQIITNLSQISMYPYFTKDIASYIIEQCEKRINRYTS